MYQVGQLTAKVTLPELFSSSVVPDGVVTAISLAGVGTYTPVDHVVTLPVATKDSLGVIRGSDEFDISDDGSINIAQINIDKIVQNYGDSVIMHSGDSLIK